MGKKKAMRVTAVFNRCVNMTIPFESFLNIPDGSIEKHILSLTQNRNQVEEEVFPHLKSGGYEIIGLGDRPNWISSLAALWRHIRKSKPQIVHVHHGLSGVIAAIMASLVPRVRVIVTLHNEFNRFDRRSRLALFITLLLADMIVCNSRSTELSIKRPRKALFPNKPIAVIYNGVDTKRIRQVANETRDSSRFFHVGNVGRLVRQKDLPTLIRGFSVVAHKHEEPQLTIAGDGKLRKELESLAWDLGLQSRVHFLGNIRRAEVYELLNRIDVFCVTSRWEGFCNAMVEAMIAGKAIVATNIDTLGEVLGTGNGSFFEPGDYLALARHFENLLMDRERLASLGKRARDYAEKRYAMNIWVEQQSKVYHRLADRKGTKV